MQSTTLDVKKSTSVIYLKDQASLKARWSAAPWHTVSVDMLGPYPTTDTRKMNISVMSDTFTKLVIAFRTGDHKTSIVDCLLRWQVFNTFYLKIIPSDTWRLYHLIIPSSLERGGLAHGPLTCPCEPSKATLLRTKEEPMRPPPWLVVGLSSRPTRRYSQKCAYVV